MSLEQIVTTYIAEILGALSISIISWVLYTRARVNENKSAINKLKQRLFGLEQDSTDEGYIVWSTQKLNRLEQKTDSIEEKTEHLEENDKEIMRRLDIIIEQTDVNDPRITNFDQDYESADDD